MSSALRDLRAQRTSISREMRNLLDQRPGSLWNVNSQAAFEERLLALDRIDSAIALDSREPANDERRFEQLDPLSPRAVFSAWARNAMREDQRKIVNTMSTTTGSQGGFVVSGDVADRFVDTQKDYSSVRRFAEVIKTQRGNTLPFPTSDGTAEVGELIAENATATSADPTFGTAPMTTYKYSSKVFAVPFELLQDSAIDVEAFIFQRAAARIGRISNTHFTTGNGTTQPQGFVGVATLGKVGTTGQTLTVIHDDLVDLVHSVSAAYRTNPNGGVAFSMADATFRVVRKIKDTAGRPIYLPSDGVSPEALLGYPVGVNDDCPTPAANAKSIFFGAFRIGYKIRDALDVTLWRFDDSAYTKLGQVGFLALARCGGNLVDPAAVRYYQHSAT